MPLNWSIEKVRDYPELYEGGSLDVWTETLIMLMPAVKLGGITEQTAPEFYARAKLIEKVHGPLVTQVAEHGKEAVPLTPAIIARRIGMSANVATATRARFLRDFNRWALEDLAREYTRQVQEEAEA